MGATRLDNVQNRGNDIISPIQHIIVPETQNAILMCAQPSVAALIVWRIGMLQHPDRYKQELAIGACAGIAVGAALTAGGSMGTHLASVVLALGYAAAILALVQFSATARLLRVFGPIGRMAFTNYVMQSVIFCLIFFGYGLGQFGRLGAAHALALGVAVYVAQMLFSAWWLARLRFGPLEWLWRTFMYGKVQPMLRR